MPRGPKGEKRPADVNARTVMIGKIATGEIEDVNDHRKRGGHVRSEILPPERRSEIARQGGVASWQHLPRATDEGFLKISDPPIPCAVLDTKQRVLTQSGVMKALGRARQAKGRSYYDGDVNLPAFIAATARFFLLNPFALPRQASAR
jgi:hypothetical protein